MCPHFDFFGRAGLRFQSTTTTIYANKKATLTVRKAWLQDPSTYPLIGIVSIPFSVLTRCIVCVCVHVLHLLSSTDIQAVMVLVVLQMATAGCLVVGVISSCLLYSPDVQISPSKRGAIMRHWSF